MSNSNYCRPRTAALCYTELVITVILAATQINIVKHSRPCRRLRATLHPTTLRYMLSYAAYGTRLTRCCVRNGPYISESSVMTNNTYTYTCRYVNSVTHQCSCKYFSIFNIKIKVFILFSKFPRHK